MKHKLKKNETNDAYGVGEVKKLRIIRLAAKQNKNTEKNIFLLAKFSNWL